MKVLYKRHHRTIAISSDTHSLVFKQLHKKSEDSSSTPAVAVELLPNEQICNQNGYKPLINGKVYGCLGLITVDKQIFLAVITGAITEVAKPVRYESVDRIVSVDFVSLSSDEWDFVNLDSNGIPVVTNGSEDYEDGNNYVRSVHPCQELRKLLSNGSFYYSNDFDLTSLLQNRGVSSSKLQNASDHSTREIKLEHYSQEYMWNSFMMDRLLKFRANLDHYVQSTLDDNRFLTTVIRGFARTVTLSSSRDSLTIISKQSWKRAGTRFNARGIDDDGNVANFVETELIYYHPSKLQVFSFTQIRGSVPAFWEQDTTLINPKITITRSLEATQPIFNKHFTEICQKYGVCHIINLLSRHKAAEVAVSRRYKELYSQSDHKDEMTFSEFDFHYETKQSGGFSGATKILPLLHESLERFGWFVYDIEQGEVVTRQDGVFRTNCLDCLDRTNLIQQVISKNVLEHISNNQSVSYGNNLRESYIIDEVIAKHNSLWADNGDAISQIYTGTNALKSSFSRSGKMNFAGALSDVTKSVSRMYQNTFVDNKKQSTMDLLLGYDARNSKPVKIYDPINDYVQEKLKGQANVFTTWNNIKIFVGTFNVNAANPNGKNIDLTTWMFPPENLGDELPDIYAIGLQELIELNAGSILNADTSKPFSWAKILEKQLNSQNEQYLLLRTEAIASMSLFLFVKKSQVHNVTQVAGSSKKTGMGGITANKGACAVRFEYGSTSFALITSHLAAGTNAIVERYNEYSTIMQGLTFTRNFTIRDHDHIIWFGDLNYRISLPNDHCRYLIDSGAFDELIKMDQLNLELTQKGAFHGFEEGMIKFYPTYKFDKGTSDYDTSEKQRVPSWTDRVLYMSAKGIDGLKQLNYNSLMDIFISDHKPIYSTFKSKVQFIDEDKKMKMAKNLYDSYKLEHGDQGDASLLELSDTHSSSSRFSSSTNNSNFAIDTLSKMNLLEDIDTNAPELPARPVTHTNTPVRRIPPPPMNRRLATEPATLKPSLPRKLPPKPLGTESIEKKRQSNSASPAPPPPRRATSVVKQTPKKLPAQLPIGFSTTPLIPSQSISSTQSGVTQVVSSNSTIQDSIKPLIPVKPSALSSNKVHQSNPLSSSTSSDAIVSSKPTAPAPPPPRTATTISINGMPQNMSDWKPLVPK